LLNISFFKTSQELSILESVCDVPVAAAATADSVDLNQTSSITITNIVTELRELQSLFSPCEQLIKETQAPDFSEEIFTINFKLLSTSLKTLTTKIEQLCEQQMAKIENNRGIITVKDQSKFVSRDPADNRKYNDDELNLSYPQNTELKKKNKQCSFTSNWYNDFPYLEYSIKKDAAFCFCCRLFGVGPGGEKSQATWSSTGVSSWSKMIGKKQ